jgi:glycerol-3-phosphate dehydrogenase
LPHSEPTDKDLKIIFPSEAKRLFGSTASRVDGTTWMVNDPPQFLNHYYQ